MERLKYVRARGKSASKQDDETRLTDDYACTRTLRPAVFAILYAFSIGVEDKLKLRPWSSDHSRQLIGRDGPAIGSRFEWLHDGAVALNDFWDGEHSRQAVPRKSFSGSPVHRQPLERWFHVHHASLPRDILSNSLPSGCGRHGFVACARHSPDPGGKQKNVGEGESRPELSSRLAGSLTTQRPSRQCRDSLLLWGKQEVCLTPS